MKADNDAVCAAYEGWAATYDQMTNPPRDLDAEVLRKIMEGRVGGRVLELGCGTGKNTVWLASGFLLGTKNRASYRAY
jgi:ubiquinone/menaquinone biosynthesis C-methylase UbiE